MIKKNKLTVIISSVIILLPILFGIIMWNELPDLMTTHFGADGNADSLGAKAFAVFGIPCIFLALHWVALIVTSLDKGQKDQNKKVLNIIFWIIPMLSLFVNCIMYCASLGKATNLFFLIPALIGVLFILMGNYMPKVKQNSTLGIKVYWAMCNEENWNKTHRFGGKVMVAGGFVLLISAFLPIEVSVVAFAAVIIGYAAAPVIYSYSVYKKHQKQGIEYAPRTKSKAEKSFFIIGMIIIPVLLIGLAVIMFTGNVDVICEDASFKINATYWDDVEISYSEIDTVEYRKELDTGMRVNGFNSAKLLLGIFQNEEFGSYTVYAYTGAKEFVVMTSGKDTLVIGMKDANETQAIYDAISEKLGEIS